MATLKNAKADLFSKLVAFAEADKELSDPNVAVTLLAPTDQVRSSRRCNSTADATATQQTQ